MVVCRRTKRRMVVGIFRMFVNKRSPDVSNKLLKCWFFRNVCTHTIYVQHLPTEVPANQAQVHLDIAVPVDTHHVRVFIFPTRQMVTKQIQILSVPAIFIKHRNMQHKLHAIHFPHMLGTAILVTANIDFMSKGLREFPFCR